MFNKLLSMLSTLSILSTSFILSYAQNPCQIIIPPFPLTYNGLITPYQTNCDMRINPSFVEAVILDLDTNSLNVYQPLIVNTELTPLVLPITFTMPKNYIVGLWFGSNANAITLTPLSSIQQGLCVYNIGGTNSKDTFGQFAHCNGIAFFEKIKEIILKNIPLNPPIPDLGIASDNEPCLTTRDFSLVDMDPSDNIITTYLIDMATGKTAQNTIINQNANPQAIVIKNGSDNLLLATLDNIMGCKPYQVTNIVDPNNPITGKISSMALDEIHAAIRQKKFYAYIPKGDPMVRINNIPSLNKINAYRQGVFQPVINDLNMADTTSFCAHYVNIQLPRLQKNKQLFIVEPSPDQLISTNLYGFLLNRFSTSYNGLNCNILLDIINPITLIMNNNLVTDGTISLIPEIKLNVLNDPYLISWDEYPDFLPTPAPTTPLPTTPVPTTPDPTTPLPTTPVPTTPVPTTPVPTTPVPTTSVPTTSVPTTHVPTTPVPTTPVPTTSSVSNTIINTNLIIILSVVGFAIFVCTFYSLKNNNLCNICKKEDNQNTQQYIDLEKSIKLNEVKVEENKENKENKINNTRLRNLSPARVRK
jgi:hypothetical protein